LLHPLTGGVSPRRSSGARGRRQCWWSATAISAAVRLPRPAGARSGADGRAVESAGFVGPDRACPQEGVIARRVGARISPHRSALLTGDVVRAADLIVVMDPCKDAPFTSASAARLATSSCWAISSPGRPTTRAIRDPVEQGVEVFGRELRAHRTLRGGTGGIARTAAAPRVMSRAEGRDVRDRAPLHGRRGRVLPVPRSKSHVARSDWESSESRVARGVARLLDLLTRSRSARHVLRAWAGWRSGKPALVR